MIKKDSSMILYHHTDYKNLPHYVETKELIYKLIQHPCLFKRVREVNHSKSYLISHSHTNHYPIHMTIIPSRTSNDEPSVKIEIILLRNKFALDVMVLPKGLKIADWWMSSPVTGNDYWITRKCIINAILNKQYGIHPYVIRSLKPVNIDRYVKLGWFTPDESNEDQFTVSAREVEKRVKCDPELLLHKSLTLSCVDLWVNDVNGVYFPDVDKIYFEKPFLYKNEYIRKRYIYNPHHKHVGNLK